jgi:hypothetical protein
MDSDSLVPSVDDGDCTVIFTIGGSRVGVAAIFAVPVGTHAAVIADKNAEHKGAIWILMTW